MNLKNCCKSSENIKIWWSFKFSIIFLYYSYNIHKMFLLVSHYPDFLITSHIHASKNYVQSIVLYGLRWSFIHYESSSSTTGLPEDAGSQFTINLLKIFHSFLQIFIRFLIFPEISSKMFLKFHKIFFIITPKFHIFSRKMLWILYPFIVNLIQIFLTV